MAGLSSSNSYLSYLIAAGVTVGTFALLGYMVSRDENKGVAPKPKKAAKKQPQTSKKTPQTSLTSTREADPNEQEFETYFGLAEKLRQEGKQKDAITCYEKALECLPADLPMTIPIYLRNNLFVLYLSLNRTQDALTMLQGTRSIVENEPAFPKDQIMDIDTNIAELLIKLEQYAEAETLCRTYVNSTANVPENHLNLFKDILSTIAVQHTKNFEEAEKFCEDILASTNPEKDLRLSVHLKLASIKLKLDKKR